jgi:trans-aconitate 2-methyltransferase
MRPALDLIERVPLDAPETIADLGCGEGAVTQVLRGRWPDAELTGVDNSAEMLEVAARELPDARWEKADVSAWTPPAPVDLLFSNAALHWIGDHAALFPRLIEWIRPGGVLAVQMPRNFTAPSHTLVADVARTGPWRDKLVPLLRSDPVAVPEFYYDLLKPRVAELDIWETEYLQVLQGSDPVAEWTRGTWRRPLLAALDDTECRLFEAEYRKRIAAIYAPRRDGNTLYPFRRLFIVARV